MIKKLLLIPFTFIFLFGQAQVGGNGTYEFLNLPNSARIAALGNNVLTSGDNDITLMLNNPSLLSPEVHNHLALSYVDYFTDINYGFATYSRTYDKIGSFAASMQFIDYGEFDYANETGERSGTFGASELAFNIGWGRQLDSLFSIGSNLKFIHSSMESYKSFGIAVDVAGTYTSKNKRFVTSLVARNIGIQLKSYAGSGSENLPFDLQLVLSNRFKHMPFRYYIMLTNLTRWKLNYTIPNDPNAQKDPITGEVVEPSTLSDFMDNAMRHVVIGGELMLGKNFSLRLAYNYKRRQEMKVESKASTVGLSWGFGFRVSKFQFSYARSAYHLYGSPNFITISTNFSDFFHRN